MKRAVPLVAGVALIAIGGLGAISGGALMAVFGSSNTLRSGTQPLQTTHLFSIGLGILIAGLVAALIGLVLLIAGLRTRRRPHAFASSTAGSAGPPADL